MQARIAAATAKTDRFLFTAFKVLLGREGGTSDFNIWDSQIVTWGMGFGGLGGLAQLLAALQEDSSAKNELCNIGFFYSNKRYHVVDVDAKKVLSSAGGNHKKPLEYWNGCDPLLSAFVGIGTSPNTRTAVLNANLKAYKNISGAFAGADALDSQGTFNFISHLHHWMPAHAGGCIGAAQAAGKSGDVEIARHAAQRFVALTAKRYGSFSKDYRVLMNTFWNQMKSDAKGDGLAFPDASEVDFDAGV